MGELSTRVGGGKLDIGSPSSLDELRRICWIIIKNREGLTGIWKCVIFECLLTTGRSELCPEFVLVLHPRKHII